MIGHRTHLSVNEKGHLEIGGVDTVVLAGELGTPLYVTDEDRIRTRYGELHSAFSCRGYGVKIKYAYKANTSLAILKIFQNLGAGADVLSEGEIRVALYIGLKPEEIIFTGNNKTDEEILYAVQKGVLINLDSIHELERLKRICSGRDVRRARVSFRINPAVSPKTHPYLATGLKESKFGVGHKEALKAYTSAQEDRNLSIEGIHMHIGSQILDPGVYAEATSRLLDIVCELKEKLGIDLKFIDLGGGFGIKYQESDRYIAPSEFADAVFPVIDNAVERCGLKRPEIFIEPGRFLVADSTILLTRVNTVKETPFKKFIGVDSGFNTLARPALYKAYHEVVVASRAGEEAKEVVTIAGNVCESGDILAHDRSLPKIVEGDLIALLDTGAYGLVMASQYNFRPRPAAVLVSGGRWILIRRRETFNDLISGEILPPDL
ncbi:MAG TPA: diaminopimelate decarboxylase [Euryarchaeota archaeon]|nr:diaminopimelate decarboxylase [archaeon BMS3Bbin16]HDH28792.1 diaminopimelate decarboxylase [Euryarchaeota archaeon]